MLTNRNQFLDVLKGILILCVVFGHTIQYGSGNVFLQSELYWEQPLMRLIYSVHMPLFMGIAGYLCYFSLPKYSCLGYIKRRWIKLFPPILWWSVIVLGWDNYQQHTSWSLYQTIYQVLTTFWFLWAILICSTLVSVCEQIKNSWLKWGIYVGLLVVFGCTPDILWWNAHKFMFTCFVSGFYVAKYQKKVGLTHEKGIISCILWMVSVSLFHKEMYIYTSGFSIIFTGFPHFYEQILIDFFRYISAALGSVSILYICNISIKILQTHKRLTRLPVAFLSYCGKHSLAIYVLSTYQIVYILPYGTKEVSPNLLFNIMETLIVIGICLVVQYLISKSKLLSRCIIGE